MTLLFALAFSALSALGQYMGAQANDASVLPNTGVRATITVDKADGGFYWVSEAMSNGLWGQVGWFNWVRGPQAFFEVWDLNTNTELTSGTANRVNASSGAHTFSMSLQSGTTWVFKMDSKTLGTWDMGTNISNGPGGYPIQGLCEGQGSAPPSPISFSGMQVQISGAWTNVPNATVFNQGSTFGIQGNLQNPLTLPGGFVSGASYAILSSGTPLWNSSGALTSQGPPKK